MVEDADKEEEKRGGEGLGGGVAVAQWLLIYKLCFMEI